jgi:hypothetical protein
LVQHLMDSRTLETLKQVQGDSLKRLQECKFIHPLSLSFFM